MEKVYLFESPSFAWAEDDRGVDWDPDGECLMLDGEEITTEKAEALGALVRYWSTVTVFATREHAEDWGSAKSYNYVDGSRVREVPFHVHDETPHPGRTHEALAREGTRDPIFLAQSRRAVGCEGVEWHTTKVFATRADGRGSHGVAHPDTDRVYCVAAAWDMVTVLAAMTVGGRYK